MFIASMPDSSPAHVCSVPTACMMSSFSPVIVLPMIRHKHDSPTHTSVITYIRTKLRFALLRSTLAAIRGFRGKRSDVHLQDFTDIDFSLIPRPTVTQINKAEQQCYKWCHGHDTSYICEIIKWVVYIDKLWLFVKLYLRTK